MSDRFVPEDLSRVATISITDRYSKVSVNDIVEPPRLDGKSVDRSTLETALPDILAASSLKKVAHALRRAKSDGREVVWMVGAHTIKTGLSRYLQTFMEHGFITCLSTTGSSIIHDLELAYFGQTSEDVSRELPAGRFGMARETADVFNSACAHAASLGRGLGAGVSDFVANGDAPHKDASVFAAAARLGIPVTSHVAIGTDITHMHPGFDAGAVGAQSHLDFRIFTARIGDAFNRGAFMLVGSAVILPEVFLKAVSVNYNMGKEPDGVTTASFDMLRHYRVQENVLGRPFSGKGEAYAITGHHEILLPLLYLLLVLD